MKPKMKRTGLMNNDDIWNAVIQVICTYDFPTENKTTNENFIVFQYFAELESGGHEMLLTWFSDYIKEVGINHYMKELISILEEIGAHDYALIEKKYIEQLWQLYLTLENDENKENEFYSIIERADSAYHKLNGKIGHLLESYFVKIHTDLIEVIED
ncbi:hypothetical protein ACFOUV_17325 [Oceanobacillus longus]|uniref:DNA mimic protein DMP19 C-terminal domain-containing protein n=1 Tax=Oceanobacillus longus TaxID=930120 RepID=A0ABV8H5C0_9BACI